MKTPISNLILPAIKALGAAFVSCTSVADPIISLNTSNILSGLNSSNSSVTVPSGNPVYEASTALLNRFDRGKTEVISGLSTLAESQLQVSGNDANSVLSVRLAFRTSLSDVVSSRVAGESRAPVMVFEDGLEQIERDPVAGFYLKFVTLDDTVTATATNPFSGLPVLEAGSFEYTVKVPRESVISSIQAPGIEPAMVVFGAQDIVFPLNNQIVELFVETVSRINNRGTSRIMNGESLTQINDAAAFYLKFVTLDDTLGAPL